ncbi:hypothetical protein VNO77_22602 [Canavalia gladiata]|uniref:Uncharacterized protein n=1 Tax=Canavalia gladiata TaxID=3824 RepID=A0AAN9L847_CANGL
MAFIHVDESKKLVPCDMEAEVTRSYGSHAIRPYDHVKEESFRCDRSNGLKVGGKGVPEFTAKARAFQSKQGNHETQYGARRRG